MTPEFFKQQVERMRTRWKNAFDSEFEALVAKEVRMMPNEDFLTCVNFLIGSRPVSRPPLLQDFRDARIVNEQRAFKHDVEGAIQAMNFSNLNIQQALARAGYPGCKTINEAVEVERLKIRVERAMNEKR